MISKIGIGVITCNRNNFLKNCIKSIKKDWYHELVIINDGEIPLQDSSKNIINNEKNLGVGKTKNKALQYLEPTKELPMNAQWEAVNMVYVQDMMKFYNISGISSQIQVQNRITNEIEEPGNHGSTITAGNALPQSQHPCR